MARVCLKWGLVLVLIASGPPVWSQAGASAAGNPESKPDQRIVISVGDEKITAADLDGIIQSLPPAYRGYYAGPGKRFLPQYLVQMKLLSAEAVKQKLEDQPKVKQELEIARESILADAARKQLEQSIPVSEEQLQAFYEQHKAEFEEVRIRQILIRTQEAAIHADAPNPNRPLLREAEARKKLEDIRGRILAGADFAQLAKENSDDQASAGSGGDLGYVNRRKAVPPVADAAFRLAPGQVSEIISTPYGLALIKVEDKRTKPLGDVKALLELQIRGTKMQETFKQLESQYKVVVDQQFFQQQQGKAAAPKGTTDRSVSGSSVRPKGESGLASH